ncbi:hypothetical protein [Bosea sp. (in: a-proteobacteria)]|uniref:hypothetical protein n=1 Tax=Bosea sp. (in: a-proteobacteria) TaxID=1871050 RepID=UPI00120AAAE0|nr:hypothetical protein [Bosea sp. (in: a-proteobacteria)]TAJ28240.1 MAG: hypothetical protein EPO59_18970 [Bosea sp. (in: a-proteobacteria)]
MPIISPSLLTALDKRLLERTLAAGGFALALGYGLAAASPAAAAPGDWRAGCQFRSIPGGAADGIRYDACMHQRDCQSLANAAGRQIFESGCFWVSPEAAQPSTQRPTPPPPQAR